MVAGQGQRHPDEFQRVIHPAGSSGNSSTVLRPRLRLGLAVVTLLAIIVAAGGVGWLLGDSTSPAAPSTGSVDAGFARDMSTHHEQAVIMAGYERDNTSRADMRVLATDIELGQEFQVGEMQGWLDGWKLPFTTSAARMAWMSPGAHEHGTSTSSSLMPGMATADEVDKLETLTGRPLDVTFLQLMIRHHQGALPMAQYALAHAATSQVRSLAQAVINSQSSEIVAMEKTLRKLGGTPLPPP